MDATRLIRTVTLCLASIVALAAPLGAGTDANGFFDEYLVLGPYGGLASGTPGLTTIGTDFLCDGETGEDDIAPEDGLALGVPAPGDPDCAGSFSGSVYAGTDPALPTVLRYATNNTNADSISFQTIFTGKTTTGSTDYLMAYSWVYAMNDSGEALTCNLAYARDDSSTVDVNGVQVSAINAGGGIGAAGTIMNRTRIVLLPGANLIQIKMFNGTGGWGLRARLETLDCRPIVEGDGNAISVGTVPPPGGVIPRIGFRSLSRSFRIASVGGNTFSVDVILAVDTDGDFDLEETFDEAWTASDPVPAGAVIGAGSIAWTGIPDLVAPPGTTQVRYRLTTTTGYPWAQAKRSIRGTVTLGGVPCVSPAGNIPGPALPRVLLTPALRTGKAGTCQAAQGAPGALTPDEQAGRWIDDGDAITDLDIIPEEGLEFRPAFGTAATQSPGWTTGVLNRLSDFFATPASIPGSVGRVVAAASSDALGYWNFATTYGGVVDNSLCVAYFYAINDTSEEPLLVYLGLGSDDGVAVRVNGRLVYNNPACRGNTSFQDKVGIGLDRGKNLIAIATFNGTGGFGMSVRFEVRDGTPIALETTLDPAGYDPDPAVHPDHSARIVPAGGSVSSVSQLGFVTQFLATGLPLNQSYGANLPAANPDDPDDPRAADFISLAGGQPPGVDNVFEGAIFEPAQTPRPIGLSVRNPVGRICSTGDLVRLTPGGGDPGLFNGNGYYSPLLAGLATPTDNYTASLFYFLDNVTAQSQEVYLAWASDDSAVIYLDGTRVAEHRGGRGYGPANSIQAPGPQRVALTPGVHLVQLSYVQGTGGAGARLAVFEKAGCVLGSTITVDDGYVPPDPRKVIVTATNPEFSPTTTAVRTLSPIDCSGNARVTLTFRTSGGGPNAVSVAEELPSGAVGSSASRGQFIGPFFIYEGSVHDGDTITYDIKTRFRAAYCSSTVNGVQIAGQNAFTLQTDICTDIALGVYINCGAAGFTEPAPADRVWLEDTLGSPAQYLTSPNTNSSSDSARPVSLASDPFVVARGYQATPFTSQRWSPSHIEYTFTNIPAGCYEVALLFNEHCCSTACSDVEDPSTGGACRVFDVTVNGEYPLYAVPGIVGDPPSIAGADGYRFAPMLAGGNVYGGLSHLVAYVRIFDERGSIVVHLQDLGTTNPPENPSICGIAIEPAGSPERCAGEPRFRRGDADAVDGAVNITDAIFVLNYLFQGGAEPPCLDAADADNEFSINITDGIYILSFLFLGGPEPPYPGPYECGPEPTDDPNEPTPLDCRSYPPDCR